MTRSPARPPALRHLVLLRHTKSSWDDPSVDDHDRPLNARGHRTGRLLARHFAQEEPPDLVLCSDARRARETFEEIAAGFARPPEALFERRLYLATAPALLDRLARVSDEVSRLILIGHNPGLHELAATLAAQAPRRRREALEQKFPTGAVARFRFEGRWREIAGLRLELVEFVTPAEFEAE